MTRDDWSDLAVFLAIAETGSFTRAGQRLNVTASALSHAMRDMERRLGVRLLNRTTRSVAPTAAGASLLARLRPATADLEAALEGLNESRDRPAGIVRVTAHRTAAEHDVLPRLARFAEDYPEITVELSIEDGLVDIVADRFDAGVRHEQKLEQDMVAVRIGRPIQTAIVASPAYFARHAPPTLPEDVRRHRCVNYRYTSSGMVHLWRFVRDGREVAIEAPGLFVTNDVGLLLAAALDGLGLACLAEPQVARHVESGALVRALQDWCPFIPPNHLYYSSRRQTSAAFAAFVAAMRRGVD